MSARRWVWLVCATLALLPACATQRATGGTASTTSAPSTREMTLDEVISFARAVRERDPQRTAHLRRATEWAFAIADRERAGLAPTDPASIAWATDPEPSDAPVESEFTVPERDARALRELDEATRARVLRFDRAMTVALTIAHRRALLADRDAELPELLLEVGSRTVQWGREGGAELTRFVRQFPGHPRLAEAYWYLGLANMRRARVEVARPLFERALELGGAGHRAAVLMYLAKIALWQSRLDDAQAMALLSLRDATASEAEDGALRVLGTALAESATGAERWIERVESSVQASRSPRALSIMLEAMLYARIDDEARQRAVIALFERVSARDRTALCAVHEESREDLPVVIAVAERLRALRASARCEP